MNIATHAVQCTAAISAPVNELTRSVVPAGDNEMQFPETVAMAGADPLQQITASLAGLPVLHDKPAAPATDTSACEREAVPVAARRRTRLERITDGRPAANDEVRDILADSVPKRLLAITMAPRLVRAREAAGLRQAEAAEKLGYANSTQLSLWEFGRRLVPIVDLTRLAGLYGVPEGFLLGTSDDMDRDPARGLRAASVRGIRGLLNGLAERLVGEISRHAQIVGPGAVHVRALLASGRSLLDAAHDIQRLNPEGFMDLRGGATLLRLAEDFEASLREARAGIDRFDALDTALRAQVAECEVAWPAGADEQP